MNKKFRDELLKTSKAFEIIFNELLNNNEIEEFSDNLWFVINKDKTPIKIDKDLLAFKDLFHQGLTEGRCASCAFELVLLLDKFGIYSEAVKCINENLKGTTGSSYGGHWYVEVHADDKITCVDTSLMIMGSENSFKKLGHNIVKKYDIDTLFKEYPELIDYYENMVINKNY